MKARYSLVSVLSLVAVCCAPGPPVLLEAVGPVPPRKETTKGLLKVYTATEEFDSEGPAYYSGYRIYSGDGRLFRNVFANGSISVANEEPTAVTLPDGTYLVEAKAEKFSVVQVPVVIEAGRLTAVHLQRHSSRSLPPGDEANWVRLPDGQIVGWRAHPPSSR